MRQIAWIYGVLLASAFGQTTQVPHEYGPGFTNKQFTYSYPGSFSSIGKIDFRKFLYFAFDVDGKPIPAFVSQANGIALQNGQYNHRETGDYEELNLDSRFYLPQLSQSDGESALILLSWSAAGGSSSQWETAQIFKLLGEQLRVVQELKWEVHGVEALPTKSFDARTSTLVIRADHHLPGDGHCCISALDIVTFKWDGNRLVQKDIRTELSKYGKREGKILPITANR
jgi:hypothetical protein